MLIDKLTDLFNNKIKLTAKQWTNSQFMRDAALLLIFNITSKAILFIGNAYAAKCLGPVNLGISALIQTTVQQTALLYNGGFDLVGVRKIAGEKETCADVTATIVSFRLCIALIVSVIWIGVCQAILSDQQKFAWMMGIPLILISAGGINFAFQGLEKLPIQNAIITVSCFLGATAYLVFFSPGMFLGADLIIVSGIGLSTICISWAAYFRMFARLPLGRPNLGKLYAILNESWRYWVLNIIIYFYTVFQIPVISYFLEDREVGIYRSCLMLASGVWLVFESLTSLLLPRLIAWKQQGIQQLWKRQQKLSVVFLTSGLTFISLIIIISPLIYKYLLGQAFIAGVLPFQILVVGKAVVFAGQVYAWGLAALKQDLQFMIASLFGAVFSVTGMILFVPRFGLVASASVNLISEVIVGLSCYFFSRRYALNNL